MQKSKLQIKIQNYLLIIGMLFLPYSVIASTVYIDTNRSEFFVGDTILFSVRVDSENKDINTVEGKVLLDHAADAASLIDINTAGSAFSLWPQKPLPSENNVNISFVGGAPGGLIAKDAVIFNFVLQLKEAGQMMLSPDNVVVYLNDGKGTKDNASAKDLVVNVLPKISGARPADDWNAIISNDKTAPEPFEISLGKDPSLFGNKYFISFFTSDEESGIAYYEVKEGDKDFIRAESPYVLEDQDLKSLIKVKAVDKAGNERIEELAPPAPIMPFYKNVLLWVFVIVIIICFVLWRYIRRRAKI